MGAEQWKDKKSAPDQSSDPKFTADDVKSWLEKSTQHSHSFSPVCAVVFGRDGTGKSGICLDFRSPKQKAEGKALIVIDLDNSCGPLRDEYFPDDPNIMVWDPTEIRPEGGIDHVTTLEKIKAMVKYIVENEEELNLAAVVFDGVNSLLKTCENVMKTQDLKINPAARVSDTWSWQIRNNYFFTQILLIKKLKCAKFYTTHMKDLKAFAGGKLSITGEKPDWHERLPGMMFQKIHMRSEKDDHGNVRFIATIEKSKGALHLEGSEYLVAEVKDGETVWHGIHEYMKKLKVWEDV